MSTRMASGQEMANGYRTDTGGPDYSLQSRASSTARMNETASGAEGRPTKRFQKSTSDGNIALSRPDAINSVRPTIDLQSGPNSRRRQSIRDQKPAPGPGSLQSSPSKRFAYDNLSNPHSSQRSHAPISLHAARSRQASINDTSRFSFSSVAPNVKQDEVDLSGSFNFLPSVNFDDLHASLASEGPDLFSLPAPGRNVGPLTSPAGGNSVINHGSATRLPSKTTDPSDVGSTIGRSGSLLRRHNSMVRQGSHVPGDSDAMGPPTASILSKTRRKGSFPAPPAAIAVSRNARKSVGPGILSAEITEQAYPKRRQSMVQPNNVRSDHTASTLEHLAKSRFSGIHDIGQTGGLATTRETREKSPKPRQGWASDNLFASSITPDPATPSLIGMARSPARSTGQRTNTPSSNKRLSIMPNSTHATGLGARTISPTDARRMKRMSLMPNPPPMPYTPPTLQSEAPYSGPRSTAQSPSMIPRKSVTPSSSRTTPDPNRKSYSSGISNSSATSYNSFLNTTGSLRLSQSLSTSRLPTPKVRNESAGAGAGGEEVVPPVPAIPKAYESPKTELEQPYFAIRKSSLPFDLSSSDTTSTVDGDFYDNMTKGGSRDHHHNRATNGGSEIDHNHSNVTNGGSKFDLETRQRRVLTIEAGSGTDRKTNGGTSNNRRTLQPLRLPPINLLPLSTPTAAKIAALYDGHNTVNPGTITPPPRYGPATTPSTPMTASRASFFSRGRQDDDTLPVQAQMRSSSSHFAIRSESSSYQANNSSNSSMPAVSEPQASQNGRQTRSPFISSSLPKSSSDFSYLRQHDASTESRSTKLTGPRSQNSAKLAKDETSSLEPSPTEHNTSSFGTNIRRKLSISRKRSCSKTQLAVEPEAELPPKPPKHDQMPPPRLPASATWSGPFLPSPSPSQHSNHLQSRRKESSSSITVQHDRSRSNTWTTGGSPKKDSIRPDYPAVLAPKRTVRSTLESGPVVSALSLKDFLHEAKNFDGQLDRDDLSAEEEMKKLASKRKDTETAAKQMDALCRRATAKERVGPMQALRMAHLNIFERGEIVDYKDVYFCGTKDAKKHIGDLSAETINFGYDDERGDYNIVGGDHLGYRYEMVDILGKGSFGQVARCVDHKTGGLVAIKIIRNKKRFHQQALVEVDILQKLREWDPQNKHSMVSFTQSFYFRGHLCISTELLGMNLYEFIKCHDFRGFSLKLIRRFAKQLLSSLVLLKSHKVIHCDLKPENILLAHPARSEIKVIDFGSSCLENEKVYTYIQSRFYRSPEVILGMTYGMPIDMWSLGCILAELLTGYPIFPGENEQEQLACIMEVFGPPEKHLIEKSTRKKLFFDSLGKPRLTVSSKGKRRRPSSKSLQQVLKCEDEAFLDFITRCLRWDPDRRLNPDNAIHHEFIAGNKPPTRSITTRPSLTTASSSPVKRYNSMYTPAGTRPLPEPPVTSLKSGAVVRTRDAPSNSPVKSVATAPKRHSTVHGMPGGGAGIKRSLNGATVPGSALPRVTPRAASGRPDLAAAAAAVSLQKSR